MIAAALLSLVLGQGEVRIAAASDLAAVQKRLVEAYAGLAERQRGNAKARVQFTFGSSGILAKQIENGAPFDLYLSANEKYVDELARKGKIEGFSVRVYALGQLGLWSADGKVQGLGDLEKAEVRRIAMANPLHAPYGVAAREVLERFWPKVEPKIVYGENVRQALQYAESGNAQAVLTAWPLLQGRPGAVRIPAAAHQPLRQAGGVVTASKNKAAAQGFLDFLSKGPGGRILVEAGFGTP